MISSVPELVATASVSFCLGWTLKSFKVIQTIKSVMRSPLIQTKMVIIVRPDLALSKGKLAAQCSHAAVSCFKEAMNSHPDITQTWVSTGAKKIILKCDYPGEKGLKSLAEAAVNEGLVVSLIRDQGRTEVPFGTLTVLGIGPDLVKNIDRVTSHLRAM